MYSRHMITTAIPDHQPMAALAELVELAARAHGDTDDGSVDLVALIALRFPQLPEGFLLGSMRSRAEQAQGWVG